MPLRAPSPICFRTAYGKVNTKLCRRRYASSSSASSITQPEECDIIIVGGGPVGLALAGALGSCSAVQKSLRVTLVEGGDLSKVRNWSPQDHSFSNRVSSLTNASQSFLTEIGAWGKVQQERTCPVEDMQVWDGVSDARISFNASELGLGSSESGQMARLTENLNLQRALLRHLQDTPHIKLLDSVKVSSIEKDEREGGGWPLVHLSNGNILRGRLLVGADGFNSPVRAYAGISSFGWSYDTQAIVATLGHHPRGPFQVPNTTAYQRFLPTGPIAFLPMSGTASSLVWSTKPDLATALIATGPDVLSSMINAAFRLPEISIRYLHKLVLDAHKSGTPISYSQIKDEILWREQSHAIDQNSAYASATMEPLVGIPPVDSDSLPPLVNSIQPGTVASFPLRYNHTDSYIGEQGARVVLVGDAAHTVHPLAGQGLNLGLADVECLARCIRQAVLAGGDVGSHTSLLPYAQERYFANHKFMSVLDKLHKLYSSTSEPLVWARSVGLEVINELDLVKAAIMASAGAKGGAQSQGWNMVAGGVEAVNGGLKVAKVVSQGLWGAVGRVLASRPRDISK